jgi:hypothetical protein
MKYELHVNTEHRQGQKSLSSCYADPSLDLAQAGATCTGLPFYANV